MELPDKLSDLLDLAVKDSQKCEKDDFYQLFMNAWHMYDGGICYVCMAGSVLAQTMGVPFNQTIEPTKLPLDVMDKLGDINSVRMGSVPGSVNEETRRNFYNIIRPSYKDKTGRADWESYTKAAEYLRSVGL